MPTQKEAACIVCACVRCMDKSDKDDNGAIVKLLACIDGRGRRRCVCRGPRCLSECLMLEEG